MKNIVLYGILTFAVLVLVWSLISIVHLGKLANTPENLQYYENVNSQTGSECGDMTDLGNVQHLSHHPDRFAECIKQVDNQIFEQAVGQRKEDYMRSNGIV